MKTGTKVAIGAGALGVVLLFFLVKKKESRAGEEFVSESLPEGNGFEAAAVPEGAAVPRPRPQGHPAKQPISVQDTHLDGRYLVVLQFPPENRPSAELLIDFLSTRDIELMVMTPTMAQLHASGDAMEKLKYTNPDPAINVTIYEL